MIWYILLAFSAAFIVGALLAGDTGNLIPGLIMICTRPSQFTMDYFVLGGLGSAFLSSFPLAFFGNSSSFMKKAGIR